MKLFLITVLSLALCGCVTDSASSGGWQKSELIGYRLCLVSPNGAIEEFSFTDAGDAIATLGSSEMVTGPVFSWKIDDDGSLRILDDSNRTFALLRLVQKRGESYIVQENGVIREFRLKKWPEYYGWHTEK